MKGSFYLCGLTPGSLGHCSPEQVVEESPGILADGVSVLQNCCIQKWSRWRIEGSQARLKLRCGIQTQQH